MKKNFGVIGMACLTMAALLVTALPFKAYGEEIKLRYSLIWPPVHPIG